MFTLPNDTAAALQHMKMEYLSRSEHFHNSSSTLTAGPTPSKIKMWERYIVVFLLVK